MDIQSLLGILIKPKSFKACPHSALWFSPLPNIGPFPGKHVFLQPPLEQRMLPLPFLIFVSTGTRQSTLQSHIHLRLAPETTPAGFLDKYFYLSFIFFFNYKNNPVHGMKFET